MAHLLVVDDEPAMREVVRRCVKDVGYEIREADNARAALAVMAEWPVDAVFCDVRMPDEDGLWLTARIRSAYPTTAVVLATGGVAPDTTMRFGVMAFLVKPFTRQALLDALAAALAWHENAKTLGPQPDAAGDELKAWLDSLADL